VARSWRRHPRKMRKRKEEGEMVTHSSVGRRVLRGEAMMGTRSDGCG